MNLIIVSNPTKPMRLMFIEGPAHDVDLLVRNKSCWPYN